MKKFVFYGSGFWAILHSIVIALVLSANLTPDFTHGVDAAITSTIRVMGIIAVTTIGQIGFQVALMHNRIEDLSTGEKWYDGITTFLALITILFMWWWMSGMAPKVAWWPVLSSWTFWIVLSATAVDLYNGWTGIKIWSGRAHGAHAAPAAHPPAAHP